MECRLAARLYIKLGERKVDILIKNFLTKMKPIYQLWNRFVKHITQEERWFLVNQLMELTKKEARYPKLTTNRLKAYNLI